MCTHPDLRYQAVSIAQTRIILATVVVALAAIAGTPRVLHAQGAADSAEVRNYVEAYQRTWNTRDAAALAALFAEDADLVMYNLPAAEGRNAIEAWWRAYFEVQEEGRSGRFEVSAVKLVAPNAAVVDVRSTTGRAGPEGKVLDARRARGTWLLRKRAGNWLIAAMRGYPTEDDAVELNASRAAAEELRPQIRAFVAAYEDAFNRKDAEALTAFYRNDADIIVRELPVVRGAQAIEHWWETYFSQPRSYRALMVVDGIRMITEDVALLNVIGTGAVDERSDQVEAVRTARATWILSREGGEWRITTLRVLPSEPDRVIRASSR